MPRPRPLLLALCVWLLTLALPGWAFAADPLDPKAIPDPLKPWAAWALDGKDNALCPVFFGEKDTSRCAWPSRLELSLGDKGGQFSQSWHLEGRSARWVPLPGDSKRWPEDVKVDGQRAIVIAQTGGPSVELAPGDHSVTGVFAWDTPPESLQVPPETGLLSLTLRGAAIPWPNRDASGVVWLQKVVTNEEGDAIQFVVHRKVTDDIPLRLETRIELRVSGKSREELLGKALPAGFVPMSLDSPLPARLEPDGRLRVQVRPGDHTLTLLARSAGPVRSLVRPAPDGPWRDGDEIWVFEAKPELRVVSVEGVASINPQQTTLPDGWKTLPAYPMKVGATLDLVEKQRGDVDPRPDQLALDRTLWLHFDGDGYTVQDRLTGSFIRDTRLSIAPSTTLGRVSVLGKDQFITRLPSDPRIGFEVRQGVLDVTADSLIAGDPSEVSAVSWAHDFQKVHATLHLPPGWRLLHATGVDDVPQAWIHHWTLLELFLALIVSIAVGRLYGVRWGVIALVMLVLTLPEVDAPRWSWLFVLALEALVRVLPVGKVKRLLSGARFAAVLIVGLSALPFLVAQVRQGLYPALSNAEARVGAFESPPSDEDGANDRGVGFGTRGAPEPMAQAVAAASAAPAPTMMDMMMKNAGGAGPGGGRGASSAYANTNAETYDPAAIVQTGPGLPHWRWSNIDLRWSGPVSAAQRLHLYLISPFDNLLLAFARVIFLALLVLRVFPPTQRVFPRGWGPTALAAAAAAVAVLMIGLERPARADMPDKATLDELAARLLREPDCSPSCASAQRLTLEAKGGVLRVRLEIDASFATAAPLPGGTAQWTPTQVLLDGQPAKGLLRLNSGVLWIELAKGSHQVLLEGALPDRDSVQLALHMKPHRVEAANVGYTIAGLHEDGLADDDLELTRIKTSPSESKAGAALQPGELPPFVRIERTVQVGLSWQVDTKIERVTPTGSAIVLEVPLLPGESVTTPDTRVQGGKVLVNIGPQAKEASWHSVLEQRSPLELVASTSLSWVEVWSVEVGPIWHPEFSGIPYVHTEATGAMRVEQWRPWPGEKATIVLSRPDGVRGQTLTIDESTLTVSPGLRSTDVSLTLTIRSSRGGEHTLVLPPGSEPATVEIDGKKPPVRQDAGKVTIPIVPGQQSVHLSWRMTPGIQAVFHTPHVELGAPSVNATTEVSLSDADRWILFAGGPRVGPAVLFWGLLLVLAAVSFALGTNRWTPLRTWHWVLLSVGLSQVSVVAGAIFVGWLLALGYRAREDRPAIDRGLFNLGQVLLVFWTITTLCILAVSLYQGLLGTPEMQIQGNASQASYLRWFTDRSPSALPIATVISVPILVYRIAMLAWALWIALSLLRWLRWGWTSFSSGGLWKKPVRRAGPMPPQPPMPPPQQPLPPMAPHA